MPPVYIVVLNYKNWQDTVECLESVFQSSYEDFWVIVVDNDSQNNSIEHLVAWTNNHNDNSVSTPISYASFHVADISDLTNPASFPRLTFIQNDTNGGFAAGNNVALKLLKDHDAYLWLLNPDITVEDNTLDELVKFAVQQSPGAIIGGVIRSASGNHELLFYGGAKINYFTATISMIRKISSAPTLDYISGACLFAHTSNLKEIGFLPEEYFLYWEETDWCQRAKQSGCQFYVCPTAVCYDKISTVIGKSFMADYFYVRNGLLFISKFKRKNLPFVLFFNAIRFLKRIFTGQWKRARGVLKGTIDFFKMRANVAE